MLYLTNIDRQKQLIGDNDILSMFLKTSFWKVYCRKETSLSYWRSQHKLRRIFWKWESFNFLQFTFEYDVIPLINKPTRVAQKLATMTDHHCVKSFQMRNFFWSVFSRIRTECGEIRSYHHEYFRWVF